MSQVKIACLEISGRQTGKSRYPGLLVNADGQPLPDAIDPETAVWFCDELDYLESVVVRERFESEQYRVHMLGEFQS